MTELVHYDWSTLIDEESKKLMCDDIDNVIAEGNFWKNSPPYQTNINIFGLPHEHWNNLKMSFIWSAFKYLDKEVQIKNVQSWSFQTSLKHVEDRDTLWHHHNHNPETKTVSGVYYMHLPDDVKDLEKAGTELAPVSPEGEGNFFVPWKTGHWMSRRSTITTRPLYCSGRYGVLNER